jgi:hypothetical protein
MEDKQTEGSDIQQTIRLDRSLPTPRERLHQNIERLQALSKQLFWDQLKQAELLTAIELVGFKVQHLAWQIQEAEDLGQEHAQPGLSGPEFPEPRLIHTSNRDSLVAAEPTSK